MQNAIFYKDKYAYWLLPEEFPTFEDFMADLHSRELPATYQMIPLRENNHIPQSTVSKGFCMAPYFMCGYRDEPKPITIENPDDIYPTQVERLTQEEYNTRLRAVIEGYCEGCMRYKPLTPRVQSLNGHHEEISLNGVCFFRYEQKPEPRSFGKNLMWLGGSVIRYKYALREAEELRQEIKTHTYVIFDSAVKTEKADGSCLLTVTPKKKELLTPYLALAMENYLENVTQGVFCLTSAVRPDVTPEALSVLAAPERREAFRKECKKYGVSLAFLTWNAQDNGRIASFLHEQEKHCFLHTLYLEAGCACLLLLDFPLAMNAIRFHTPMLEPFGTEITVHGQAFSRRYTVSFDMPYETLN